MMVLTMMMVNMPCQSDKGVCVRLCVRLCVGRTHQLRVHCCALGHRIIGDYMYSDRQDVSPPRMMLHAVSLIIPMKHEHITVTTHDPFTSQQDTAWRSTAVYNTLHDHLSRTRHITWHLFNTFISLLITILWSSHVGVLIVSAQCWTKHYGKKDAASTPASHPRFLAPPIFQISVKNFELVGWWCPDGTQGWI